ncbi:hypothetical protein HMPREF1586_00412 [Gardnerella vaginalis JCP8522]|nr:hypothetical protein HMPREF1586_00412 [Gardnerella vaginalis JCP8522]
MGGNPFGLILSIGSVRIVVSFTCCDLRRAFYFPCLFPKLAEMGTNVGEKKQTWARTTTYISAFCT